MRANSRRQWRTGESGMLQSTELQRVRRAFTTEQQQMAAISLRNFFLNNKTLIFQVKIISTFWSTGYRMDSVCQQVWKQHSSHCTSPSELFGDQVHCQWAVTFLKESFFFWAVGLSSGFKIFWKPCRKQMCCHLGLVPFTEHRQSRISIILKSPRIFRIVNEQQLQLKMTLAPNTSQPVLWSF